jgi:hypothetical protein
MATQTGAKVRPAVDARCRASVAAMAKKTKASPDGEAF